MSLFSGFTSKLEGASNYSEWEFQLIAFLEYNGLGNYVKDPYPNGFQSDATLDAKTCGIIKLSLSSELALKINTLKNAQELLKEVKDVIFKNDNAYKINLYQQLFYFEFSDNIQQSMQNMQELEKKFLRCGIQNIPTQLFIMKLIFGLPDSFNITKKILLNFSDKEITWKQVEIAFIDNSGQSYSNPIQINTASSNLFCVYCKRKNHNIQDCWRRKKK